MQAGSSEDGKDLAAKYAEAVFVAHQTLADAQAFYGDLKSRTHREGRDPNTIKILPGIVPVLGGTEREAKENEAELEAHIVHEHGQRMLAGLLRVPIDQLDLDSQLPDDLPAESEIEDFKSRYSLIVELGRREHLTIRQLIGRLGGGRGHFTFAGTPEQVANMIEEWFTNGAADGFNIMPALLAVGTRGVRRAGGADPSRPRAVPTRVHGRDPARPLRTAASRESARPPRGRERRDLGAG